MFKGSVSEVKRAGRLYLPVYLMLVKKSGGRERVSSTYSAAMFIFGSAI
jgi:hypothetical protein